MAISSSPRVDQKSLAKSLGVTPRRVRQMVSAHLLPPPNDEGFDLQRCREWYALYSNGSPRAWRDFHEELGAFAIRVERLVRKAETGSKADLKKASQAAAEMFDAIRFSIAATSDCDAERNLMNMMFDQVERDTFGPILRRTYHVLGAEQGLSEAEIEAQIEALGSG